MLDAGEIERLLGRCALGDRAAFGRLYAGRRRNSSA